MENNRQDDIYRKCLNCGADLPEGARYCQECGQKNTDGRVTLWEMLRDLIDSIFNIDSKIFRTIGALFIPGKLTIAYFQGKHRKYIPPIRIILLSTIVLIAAVSWQTNADIVNINDLNNFESTWHKLRLMGDLEQAKEETSKKFESPEALNALDSMYAYVEEQVQDTIPVEAFLEFNQKELHIATVDLFEMPMDSIYYHYEIEGFFQQLLAKQTIRLFRRGDSFGQFLISKISWMVLIVMPLLALVMKFFYIRRKFYYVEHLVFCFHTHAFLFLGFILMLLLGQNLPPSLAVAILAIQFFYLLFAFKRFYRQPWLKTIIKFSLIGVLYLFLIFFATAVTLIIGFFIF